MEIFKTFGIDPFFTLASVVNFLIILLILKRFLYKPIFKVIDKRAQLAKETIDNAEKSKELLEKTNREAADIIERAHKNSNQIMADAKAESIAIVRQAQENAVKQTEHIIREARNQIAQETKEAQSQLSKHVSRLSMELLQKSLTNVFSEEQQNEIVKKAVKEFQKKPN